MTDGPTDDTLSAGGAGRLAIGLLVGAIGAVIVWAVTRPETAPAPPAPVTPTTAVTLPLLKDWGTPAATLVISGQAHGHLEPCGCSEHQPGGLARRASLFQTLREDRGLAVGGLELGGLLHPYREDRRQEQLKFNLHRRALIEMGYNAMAWGPEEIFYGADELFRAYNNATLETADQRMPAPFVMANVHVYAEEGFDTPLPYRVFTVGDVTIGVTAILGEETWETMWRERYGSGASPGRDLFPYEPPATALERILPQVEAESPDVLVLLSHASPEESTQLAEQFPQFDLIVAAGSERPMPERIGDTLLIRVGKEGKHVGVVGIEAVPNEGDADADGDATAPKYQLKYELVELDKHRFAMAASLRDLMREYQQGMQDSWPGVLPPPITHVTGASFVGVDNCKDCHTSAYAVWSNSAHSQAMASLEHGREDERAAGYEPIDRSFDPECLACHSTGWRPQEVLRYASGFDGRDTSPHLLGNQCENCHGPGSRHVELERAVQSGGVPTDEVRNERRALHLTQEQARDNLCFTCHDTDNSPDFNWELYWPKVEHKGRH